MKQAVATFAVVFLALAAANAGTISDNFESYALGSFPSPTWLDAGAVQADPRTPIPSATVVATTDAFGNPTQALAVANAVSNSRGIYAPVAVSTFYTLSANIRVDQFSDHPADDVSDWPMELTFVHNDGTTNFCCIPSAGIFASSLTGHWGLFVLGPSVVFADIDFGATANIGTWYGVSLTFDLSTGTFHSSIVDVATGTVLVNRFDVVAGLDSSNTGYNGIAFLAGEVSPGDTVPDLAVVDNVNIGATPEPSTLLLISSGLSLATLRFRKR
jgi:hypothetical protein